MQKDAASEPDVVQAFLRSQPSFLRELLAGGIAGAVAKTSIAPLERTKILFQTGRLAHLGVPGTLAYLWRTEGVAGLFRGNGASVLRIVPYAAIHYGSYEWYRRMLLSHLVVQQQPAGSSDATPHVNDSRPLQDGGSSSISTNDQRHANQHVAKPPKPQVDAVWDLVAGSLAGATAVIATYPLDLVRTRLAYATDGKDSHVKHSIRTVMVDVMRSDGFPGLYRGAMPTLWGVLPYAGLKFYVYTGLKNWYRSSWIAAEQHSLQLPVYAMLAFGAVSGLFAQTLTYPLDVIRRRFQIEGLVQFTKSPCKAAETSSKGSGKQHASGASGVFASSLPRHTTWSIFRDILREEGTRGLFRGISINYMKVVPSTAIGFTVYESCKAYLGVQSSI